jgi:RNA polymerase sigma factor (sigma-70 family)
VCAWARGDLTPDEAFEQLYARYGQTVRAWLALRVAPGSVDDLFQDVWTIFFRRCREWQHREEFAAGDARPVLSFLFRTCHLVVTAHRRVSAQRRTEALEDVDPPAIDDDRRMFADVQLGECLGAAKRFCSDEDVTILTAKLAGVPARDIARALRVTESAVDHRFRRAIGRIRGALKTGASDGQA